MAHGNIGDDQMGGRPSHNAPDIYSMSRQRRESARWCAARDAMKVGPRARRAVLPARPSSARSGDRRHEHSCNENRSASDPNSILTAARVRLPQLVIGAKIAAARHCGHDPPIARCHHSYGADGLGLPLRASAERGIRITTIVPSTTWRRTVVLPRRSAHRRRRSSATTSSP